MADAFTALWQDAVARLQPQRVLLIGPGADGLAASVLSLTESWGGVVDLAWPAPASVQPPRDGQRFTLHRARPQDATSLLPLPGLVIVESGGEDLSAPTLAGVLEALKVQARRTGKPFPLVLLAGARAPAPATGRQAGAEMRPPALAALEDFVATEAPALIHAVMPLAGGIAALAGRTGLAADAIRAVFASLAMGKIAALAVAEADAALVALRSEVIRRREHCAAAERRAEHLYEALRRAHLAATPKMERGVVSPQPDDAAAIARLRRSPVLQEAWYQARYPDVAASGMDAAAHYYWHGAAEGRDPGPDFTTAYYLASQTDVAQSRINPLLHFLDYGAQEGRMPGPDFDPAYYLATNPDVAKAELNPLEHFVAQGRSEGRRGLPPP